MRLEIASRKAIEYACLNFHYAKRIPAQPMTAFNVFNDKKEWCGVIIFNLGLGNINKPFNLKNGEVCELARVALNGKQSFTSQAVSISIKLFKKMNPLCKLLVSYADSDQNHNGVIYQAMNWYFISSHRTSDKYIDPKTGQDIHSRAHSSKGFNKQFGTIKKVKKTSDLIRIRTGVKHKYVYPLCNEARELCEKLKKEYPKSVQNIDNDVAPIQGKKAVQV